VSEDRKTVLELRTAPLFTRGRVTAVDVAKRTITIDVERQGKTWTLAVAKGAKVELSGKPANLAAVAKGADVLMELAAAKKDTVLSIGDGKLSAVVVGDVKSTDLRENTLTVTNEEGDRALPVAKDAKVVIGGKARRLADLKAGVAVDARMSEDFKTVVGVTARRP
jgi:hypothetical protein